MGNDVTRLRVRWLAGVATRIAARSGKTAVDVLGEIQDAIFSGDIASGKVLISTNEGGGSASFTIPPGHSPMEIGDLCQHAIDYLNGKRFVRRLRVSFARATSA